MKHHSGLPLVWLLAMIITFSPSPIGVSTVAAFRRFMGNLRQWGRDIEIEGYDL
jgi:hypothetical protein